MFVLHFNRNFAPHGFTGGFETDLGRKLPTSETHFGFAPQMHLGDRPTGGPQRVQL